MKKYLIKYSLEFLVIVMGISISFLIEKRNLKSYNDELKNISLEKIYKNLSQDVEDLNFNMAVHNDAIISGNQILNRGKELFENEKDSLGYHLTLISTATTFFLDNQEEYSAIKNSGLIELIENQEIVSLLQTRYSETKVYSIFDDLFMKLYFKLKDYTFKNISSSRKQYSKFYGPLSYGIFLGENPIDNEIENYIYEKTAFHKFYVSIMEARLKEDLKILALIERELSKENIFFERNSFYDAAQKIN
jgi:hypothetical protein